MNTWPNQGASGGPCGRLAENEPKQPKQPSDHAGLTQANRPPRNPARFSRRDLNSHEATPRRSRSAPHSAVRHSWPAPWSTEHQGNGLLMPFQQPQRRGARSEDQSRSLAQEAGPWRLRQPWFTRVALPNPSFKPSPNGGPPGPGRRYAVHCLRPGPGVPPSVPA